MKLTQLAIGTLLLVGMMSPAQADVYCWSGEEQLYCTDKENEWRGYLSNNINQLYQEVLGRDADRRGLNTYVHRVDKGKSLEWVRSDLAKSEEVKDRLNLVYQEILGREADRHGLDTYGKKLRRGWSIAQVRTDIVDSLEARSKKQFIGSLPNG